MIPIDNMFVSMQTFCSFYRFTCS